MATLATRRSTGGVVGDSYFDASGEWQIQDVLDDGLGTQTGIVTGIGDYNWGLIDTGAGVITPPDTVGTLSARVDTIETALGADVLDCSFDMVVLLENQLL